MSSDVYMKRNDTGPALVATLQDANGTAVDLTGASVMFKMRRQGETAAVVDAEATITDEANGAVRYDWVEGDTKASGIFEGEFEATLSSGKVETFPNDGHLSIEITADVS